MSGVAQFLGCVRRGGAAGQGEHYLGRRTRANGGDHLHRRAAVAARLETVGARNQVHHLPLGGGELALDLPVDHQQGVLYVAAHPDWTGAEEARRIERVQAFTRRFAYLLDGMDLEEKPPGHQWWTLRRLLEQMQRHYEEHTVNVEKKFALPDWPEE